MADSNGCFAGCFGGARASSQRPADDVGRVSSLGLCDMLSLARNHPKMTRSLMSFTALRSPHKVNALLRHTDARAVHHLCNDIPEHKLTEVLSMLMSEGVSFEKFEKVVVPLLRHPQMAKKLAHLLRVVETKTVLQIVNDVAPEKITKVLDIRTEALVSLMAAVDANRVPVVLIPVLGGSCEQLESSLVPLVDQVEKPERIAQLVNTCEPNILIWFLYGAPTHEGEELNDGVDAKALAAILNQFNEEDLQPNGCAVKLLQQLADNRGLVREKVTPLLKSAKPEKLVPLIQGIDAAKLLNVLRSVKNVEGVLRLLENTNLDIVVRIFNGPLDKAGALVAGDVAQLVSVPEYAEFLKNATDVAANVLGRGQRVRGQTQGDGVTFIDDIGDFTAGLHDMVKEDVERLVELGRAERLAEENLDSESSPFSFGGETADLVRGLVARQKPGWDAFANSAANAAAGFPDLVHKGLEAAQQRTQVLQDQLKQGYETQKEVLDEHVKRVSAQAAATAAEASARREQMAAHVSAFTENQVSMVQKALLQGKKQVASCTLPSSYMKGKEEEIVLD
eukprot:TRINITY_DN60742_c0_g1_i1.p1 TRINITY_DN60742_c0_g1~~TRINITY_DN60742_c0_g1_i1.p1  ORF type:complete len:578 (+),score=141.46 TRINITY_DN60742_c0_g1_i1:43-1734(+)